MRKTICLCISILFVLLVGVSCTQYQYWPIPMPSVEKYTITLVVGNGETEEHSIKEGSSYVLPGGYTADEKKFVGWIGLDGTSYDAGDEITPTADAVFTGDWISADTAIRINGEEYATTSNAIAGALDPDTAKDGTVIEIFEDEPAGSGIMFPDNSPVMFPTEGITFDFNNTEFTCTTGSVGSTDTETQLMHLTKGNKITIKDAVIKNENPEVYFMIQNYSDLVLDNVELIPDEHVTYLLSINNGVVKLKNGTKLTLEKSSGHYIFDLYYWPNGNYPDGCTMIVEDDSVVLSGNINISDDGTDSENFPDKVNFVVPIGYLGTQDVVITAPGYEINWVDSTYPGYTDGYEMMVLTEN